MIKDSGKRREFATGAVRDIQEGKGRCDLLPLYEISSIFRDSYVEYVLRKIEDFKNTGDCSFLFDILKYICDPRACPAVMFDGESDMILEVSQHFEEGAKKYGEYNWQKGIPVRCYIDSAVRHYLKFVRGDDDERHDRAFVWNILCCIWTMRNKPELNDLQKEDIKQ